LKQNERTKAKDCKYFVQATTRNDTGLVLFIGLILFDDKTQNAKRITES